MLYQLMYSSRMRSDLSASDLERLLVKARGNNAARQVTGVLVVVEDVFVQILEGDKQVVTALARPESWGTQELHVEIETYTWDILPRAARGPGELVDGLEREYAHVLARLDGAGWKPA